MISGVLRLSAIGGLKVGIGLRDLLHIFGDGSFIAGHSHPGCRSRALVYGHRQLLILRISFWIISTKASSCRGIHIHLVHSGASHGTPRNRLVWNSHDIFWRLCQFRPQPRRQPDTDPNCQSSECDNPKTPPVRGCRGIFLVLSVAARLGSSGRTN